MSNERDKNRIAELEQRVADLESDLADAEILPPIIPKAVAAARWGFWLSCVTVFIGLLAIVSDVKYRYAGDQLSVKFEEILLLAVPPLCLSAMLEFVWLLPLSRPATRERTRPAHGDRPDLAGPAAFDRRRTYDIRCRVGAVAAPRSCHALDSHLHRHGSVVLGRWNFGLASPDNRAITLNAASTRSRPAKLIDTIVKRNTIDLVLNGNAVSPVFRVRMERRSL